MMVNLQKMKLTNMDYPNEPTNSIKQPSPLEMELQTYEKELAVLQDIIDSLTNKLIPLLLPPMGDELAGAETPSPPSSVFVSQIHDYNMKFSRLNNSLKELKQRIEL